MHLIEPELEKTTPFPKNEEEIIRSGKRMNSYVRPIIAKHLVQKMMQLDSPLMLKKVVNTIDNSLAKTMLLKNSIQEAEEMLKNELPGHLNSMNSKAKMSEENFVKETIDVYETVKPLHVIKHNVKTYHDKTSKFEKMMNKLNEILNGILTRINIAEVNIESLIQKVGSMANKVDQLQDVSARSVDQQNTTNLRKYLQNIS